VAASEWYTDRVRVTWGASAYATGYEVWRHTSDDAGAATRIAPSLSGASHDDSSAASGVYYYWVKAKNGSGRSGFGGPDVGFVVMDEGRGYFPLVASDCLPGAQPTPTPSNPPPDVPSSPVPEDGATDQEIDLTLQWQGGDPDGDAVTYDVYLEAGGGVPGFLLCNDVAVTACDSGTLAAQTVYSWYVVATDSHGATSTGPAWSFTTGPPFVVH
jgi:hypothetical protein